MLRTRIKICGITREEDALAAAHAGADALGFMFYGGSPRVVTLAQAQQIAARLPAFVATVALFVNAEQAEVAAVERALRPTLLQFHGDESPAWCAQFATPWLKAVRVGGAVGAADLLQCRAQFSQARGLLLDADKPGSFGGTGEAFDWQLIPPSMRAQIVLAGGLNEHNVGAAIQLVRPWAVDVSSGVEEVGGPKGIKDHARIRSFVEQVRRADERV